MTRFEIFCTSRPQDLSRRCMQGASRPLSLGTFGISGCLPLALAGRSPFTARRRIKSSTKCCMAKPGSHKAERLGMRVVLQDERYSSQTCPACNKRNKPQGRGYRCGCGFRFHRDGVGAVNLRRTYLGLGPVVGVMASPIGLRFQPHALSPTAARSAL